MALNEEWTSSYKYVVENSKHVKINYEAIDKMIEKIENSESSFWLSSNPFGLLDMDFESLVNFLIIYHTIGNYCFWGDPKWEIETSFGNLDGSYAIMYLIINRYKANQDFNMTFLEFKYLLKGNTEIPLIEDRYQKLVKMNEILKEKSFYQMVKNMKSDTELLNFILEKFDYFNDVSDYKGKKIYFYKRAQLLTSDLLHVKEIINHETVDYSHLIGCADYKIPQVMRCYGMLEFDQELAKKVDSKIEIVENSEEEIEIRANDLEVIDYIYIKTNKKYSKMEINDFIWLLGQDKTKMTKLYHRTITDNY